MPDHVYDESGYFDDAEDEPLFRGRNPDLVESEGYMFGMELAGEARYRSREWEDIEDELRRVWRQRYGEEPFDAHIQEIIRGWGDGLLGPDPDLEEDLTALDAVNGSAPMGDLGDTVRIVSSDEMEGKIDKYYVDHMDDLSDMPDIDSEGNRGDDSAHLD